VQQTGSGTGSIRKLALLWNVEVAYPGRAVVLNYHLLKIKNNVMAISKRNVITHGLSGMVGDLVVFRQRHGKTFLGKIPINTGKVSPDQQAVREKFLKAVSYAKAGLRNPAIKALYEQKAGNGVTSFNLAIADFFAAPVIAEIITSAYTGAAGSRIEVHATDDTKVTEVKLSIIAAGGSAVEEGAAQQDADTGHWFYTATAANASLAGSKITVVAKDLPGNITPAEKVL
jgi:hypothetical protein